MVIKNPRINITFAESIASLLVDLAHQEKKSVASFVRDLTIEGLEMREDFYLSKIAEKLDKNGVKRYTHDEVWK